MPTTLAKRGKRPLSLLEPTAPVPPRDKFDVALEKIDALVLTVHRLEQTVRCRLAPPLETVDLKEAARRLGRRPGGFNKDVRLGIFTDLRGGRTQGSKRGFYVGEIEVYRIDGPAGVKRLRESLGRL